MRSCDVIVIGGGHNGLTAATVLAKAGCRVVLVEQNSELGGGLRGDLFHPGYRSPGLAHSLHRLDPEVAALIGWSDAGNTLLPTALLSEDRPPVLLQGAYGETLTGIDPDEAAAFQRLRHALLFQSGILARFLKPLPPRLKSPAASELLHLTGTALSLLSRGREPARDVLRMLLINAADPLDEYLTDDRLKGLLAFDATLGSNLGPRSPTSLIGLYYRLAGAVGGARGGLTVPKGGMGALNRRFIEAAQGAGVDVITGVAITQIRIDNSAVRGVTLSDGQSLSAPFVLSAIPPKTALLALVDPAELGTDLRRALTHVRAKGNVARLDLALASPVHFAGLSAEEHRARIVIASSLDAVENAYNPSKYGELSDSPVMEVMVSSRHDSSLAPETGDSLSILVPFVAHDLRQEAQAAREQLIRSVIRRLTNFAPDLANQVIASRCLLPRDIAQHYGIEGGHWHHGELQPDQMLFNRPVHALSRHATPITGLYLGSAGSHPGGGISGRPGLNAARTILAHRR